MRSNRYSRFFSGFFFVIAIFSTCGSIFAQDQGSTKSTNDLFFYLSPTLFYRTDSHYPAAATTSLPEFRDFYEYERIPLIADMGWQNYIGNFSTYFSFPLRRSYLASGAHSLGTNFPYEFFDIDTNFPFKGYLCWENNYFGFKLARDKIDLGPGYWSSVELNKQNPYWDYIRFFYNAGRFRLTEYIIRLDPILVTGDEQTRQDSVVGYRERAKNIVLHEFQWSLADSLVLTIGEFIMIGGRSLQVSDINPMLVFHNFYGEAWGNVAAFINLRWQLSPSVLSYFDLVIDDLVAPVEAGNANTAPAAGGVLIGLQTDFTTAGDRRFFWVLEATYITPTFGTRSQPLQTFYARRMYIDNTAGGKRVYVDYPVSYYLGNDLIDFRTAFTATLKKRLDLTIDYHLLFKGEETLKSDPDDEGDGIHQGYLPRGVVEVMNELRVGCSYYFSSKFSAGINGRVTFLQNKDHISGQEAFNYGIGATFTSILF